MRSLRITLIVALLLSNNELTKPQVVRSRVSRVEVSAHDIATNRTKLAYRGYVIHKNMRKIRIDDRSYGGRLYFEQDEYARLTRKGRILLRFDGLIGGVGNSIEFGLFSFLRASEKQLLVSQDTFRGGKQWIVRLRRSPRILYDGHAWATGREIDDMSVIDLDGDGKYEVIVPTCIFYGFASLSPAATPLPSIVFKYSRESKKFLPANLEFAEYLLNGIEDRKRTIQAIGSPPDNMNHLGDVLGIVLEYLFAGHASEAWTFYDQAYKLPDKHEMKDKILAELRSSPVYRFIYHKHNRRRTT